MSAAGPSRPHAHTYATIQRQCIACGRSWPWAVFTVEVDSGLCTRCARPDMEVQRWFQIHNQMRASLLSARAKVIRAQLALQATSASSIPSHAVTPAPPPSARLNQNVSTVDEPPAPAKAPGRSRGSLKLPWAALQAVSRNRAWALMKEPQRASACLQIHFRPAPHSHMIRQVDLFQAYVAAVKQLPDPKQSPLEGTEVIKLVMEIWSKDHHMKMEGSPLYAISGIEARPPNEIASLTGLPELVDTRQHVAANPDPAAVALRQQYLLALSLDPSRPASSEAAVDTVPDNPSVNVPEKERPAKALASPINTFANPIVYQTSDAQNQSRVSGTGDKLEGSRAWPGTGHDQARDTSGAVKGKELGGPKKRRRSSVIPANAEVIVIDDEEEEEDEWSALKGREKSKGETKGLSYLQMTSAPVVVGPRSRLPSLPTRSRAASMSNSAIPQDVSPGEAEEEIDELDSDDDVRMTDAVERDEKYGEVEASDVEAGAGRVDIDGRDSEDEVGDILE